MLQNLTRVPKKGLPTGKARRRNTLLEQREDAHRKKMKEEEKNKDPSPERNLDQRKN